MGVVALLAVRLAVMLETIVSKIVVTDSGGVEGCIVRVWKNWRVTEGTSDLR